MLELDDIVRCTNIYLAAKDKDSKYTYCNEAYAQFLDIDSPQQIVGKSDHDLFTHHTAEVCRSGDGYVLEGGALLNNPETVTRDNRTLKILTAKSQAKNRNGNLAGVILSFTEIKTVNYKASSDILPYNSKRNVYEFKIGDSTEYFTVREHDVFKNIFLGLSAKQIAQRLSISPRTVESHIERIKHKLQCGYKSNIVEAAIRYGIVGRGGFCE